MALEAHDILMLERAFSLAEKGRGCTTPNPVVGAVITRDGHVVGEGHHAGPGLDHAEIAALKDAAHRAGFSVSAQAPLEPAAAHSIGEGATIYVTLEPCCTFGRTPPCTDALIAAGFARVVVGAIDPSPAVNGAGIAILREAGITVDVAEGDVSRRMKRQNDGLRKIVATGLPFVTYKYAMTADGRLATDTGDSRWISSAESRLVVHRWRADSDAVVVGAGTARVDDPQLTARDVECSRQPLRVVVGRAEGLPAESALVRSAGEGPVLVIGGEPGGDEAVVRLMASGIEVATVSYGSDGHPEPRAVAQELAGRGVQSLLLEGGRRLAGAWWEAGLIDRVACFLCPKVAPGTEHRGALVSGGPALMGDALALREVEVRQIGPDVLMTGYMGDVY